MGYTAAAIGVAAGATAYSASQQPGAPNYAAANREGILTDMETLPLRRLIDSAAKNGDKIDYYDPRTVGKREVEIKDPKTGEIRKQIIDDPSSPGIKRTADFTGLGDADLSKKMLAYQLDSADVVAKKGLELSQKYGTDYVEQRRNELEASDPTGFKIREEMGTKILGDLMSGKGLDAQTQADVIQAERAGQAARGNIMGSSSSAAEAMGVGDAGFRLWQQKLANASAFLSGTTPTAQFSQLSGAQTGASPFAPQAITPGISLNPNAGAQASGFAQSNYATASSNFNSSPWTSLLGSVAGVGVGYAGKQIGKQIGTG